LPYGLSKEKKIVPLDPEEQIVNEILNDIFEQSLGITLDQPTTKSKWVIKKDKAPHSRRTVQDRYQTNVYNTPANNKLKMLRGIEGSESNTSLDALQNRGLRAAHRMSDKNLLNGNLIEIRKLV
jgi:hypothetical protein